MTRSTKAEAGIADERHVAGVAGAARRSAAGRGVHAAAGGSAGHLRRRSLGAAGQRRDRAGTRPSGSCKGISSCSSRSWRTSRRSSGTSTGSSPAMPTRTRPTSRGRSFDLPGVPNLLRRFPPGGDWAAFVGDPNNPVARALHDAAESRTDVLDRRNRMLDHLLARQGEDTVALRPGAAPLGTDWSLLAVDLPSVSSRTRIAARRDAANARLIRIKAALLRDAPELNAFRLLANSNPLSTRRRAAADRTDARPDSAGIWRPTVRSGCAPSTRSPTSAAASIAAENALVFAARAALYIVVARRRRAAPAATEGRNVACRSGRSPRARRRSPASPPPTRRVRGDRRRLRDSCGSSRRWRRSNDASRI